MFITFEGIEGTGKTTQVQYLARALQQQGYRVLVTREPGGCPIADHIRSILLDPASSALVPKAELLLYAAARAQHVEEVIRPALQEGQAVLCDRFTDATLAYQGYGRGLDLQLVHDLNRLATDGLVPDLTILLDMPAETGLQRARQRNSTLSLQNEERFEQESVAFHRRIRKGYLEMARQNPRFRLVEATGRAEEVAVRIARTVEAFIGEGGSA